MGGGRSLIKVRGSDIKVFTLSGTAVKIASQSGHKIPFRDREIYRFGLPKGCGIRYTAFPGVGRISI